MRLFIIRHADPDYENHTITKVGHKESKALAKRLQCIGLDVIYCSPIFRAIHTMRYAAKMLNMKPIFLDWLKELSELRTKQPPWGALMAWDVPAEIIRGLNRNWSSFRDIPSLKRLLIQDTLGFIRRKSDGFLFKLGYKRERGRYRILRSNHKKICVFCHNGFALTWLSLLLEIPLPLLWGNFWLAPTSVTTILFDERSDKWATPRVIGLGDISHLHKGNISVSTHGLKANIE